MNKPRIGLVGVGLMGHGIALNIARKGYALAVLEHPGNQPLDELRALGVTSAATVRALARQVEVVILVRHRLAPGRGRADRASRACWPRCGRARW
jgi:prephenate dehydrogenase